ncbi:MAG: GTPase domain-containing protein [Nitrospirota bacterium]
MALFNYATKEITIKVVYYGPGLSGKTTNLQYLYSILNPNVRGKFLSLSTEADRTLFFDFLPVALGKIQDFSIRFQLYTVPGQVRYNATRRLVLKGADAVVFVADSQREMREQNLESLKNMYENLLSNNINPDDIPVILQFNKRDLSNILTIDELNQDLNEDGKYEYLEAAAINGTGVEDSFQRIKKLVIDDISKKHNLEIQSVEVVETTGVKVAQKMEIGNPVAEKSLTTGEGRSTVFENPRMERTYKMPELKKESLKTASPLITAEKLDILINSFKEISQTLKEIKNLVSNLHYEIKDTKKEQKESNVLLKDIRNNFEKLKTKRRWFRF